MSTLIRAVVTYVPGAIFILFGAGATAVIPFAIGMLKTGITDSFVGSTSEGIQQRGGQLGPWRPATPADVADPPSWTRVLPAERLTAREGRIDIGFHRAEFTILRDRTGESRDAVVNLNVHWRFGEAVPPVLLCTAVPIGLGILWLRIMRRLLPRNHVSDDGTIETGPTKDASRPRSAK